MSTFFRVILFSSTRGVEILLYFLIVFVRTISCFHLRRCAAAGCFIISHVSCNLKAHVSFAMLPICVRCSIVCTANRAFKRRIHKFLSITKRNSFVCTLLYTRSLLKGHDTSHAWTASSLKSKIGVRFVLACFLLNVYILYIMNMYYI